MEYIQYTYIYEKILTFARHESIIYYDEDP